MRLAHASNPENTIDEQAVDLAITCNKSFGALTLRVRAPNATSIVSASKFGGVVPICSVITVFLSTSYVTGFQAAGPNLKLQMGLRSRPVQRVIPFTLIGKNDGAIRWTTGRPQPRVQNPMPVPECLKWGSQAHQAVRNRLIRNCKTDPRWAIPY